MRRVQAQTQRQQMRWGSVETAAQAPSRPRCAPAKRQPLAQPSAGLIAASRPAAPCAPRVTPGRVLRQPSAGLIVREGREGFESLGLVERKQVEPDTGRRLGAMCSSRCLARLRDGCGAGTRDPCSAWRRQNKGGPCCGRGRRRRTETRHL